MNKTYMKWFKEHWKDRETMSVEDFAISHLDFMIFQHNLIIKEIDKAKRELIDSIDEPTDKRGVRDEN